MGMVGADVEEPSLPGCKPTPPVKNLLHRFGSLSHRRERPALSGAGGRCALSTCTTKFAAVTVVALVALRLSIGWHFYKEGEKKWVDPNFSATPFLLQAKGPLEPLMQSFVTEGHEWRKLLAQPQEKPPEGAASKGAPDKAPLPLDKPYSAWAEQIVSDWDARLKEFAGKYSLDEQQTEAAVKALKARNDQLLAYLDEQADKIAEYRFELWRLQQWKASPLAGGVPYQETRIAVKTADVTGRPGVWINQVGQFGDDLQRDLQGLLTEDQKGHSALSIGLPSMMTLINKTVTYWVLGVGVLLILGLFTRFASIAGALFLMSVVAMQPPWVPGAQPVYYQWIEMMALLVLATTPVGRWGGLDFFLHALFRRRGDNQGETI
jgi:uncharacterized membrane protein YphA (DoxX/SURF4 family)